MHYKNIPDVSVDERHMISMSNLGTLVKFSRYLTAKSMSSLSEEQTRREIKLKLTQTQSQTCRTWTEELHLHEEGGHTLDDVD